MRDLTGPAWPSPEDVARRPPRPTFNPAVPDTDGDPRATCEDCGYTRAAHRDGGLAYGLVCPSEAEARAMYGDR